MILSQTQQVELNNVIEIYQSVNNTALRQEIDYVYCGKRAELKQSLNLFKTDTLSLPRDNILNIRNNINNIFELGIKGIRLINFFIKENGTKSIEKYPWIIGIYGDPGSDKEYCMNLFNFNNFSYYQDEQKGRGVVFDYDQFGYYKEYLDNLHIDYADDQTNSEIYIAQLKQTFHEHTQSIIHAIKTI